MRILALSDIHDAYSKVRKLKNVERDITVVAGDVVEFGKPDMSTVVRILEELASQTLTLYVPGNCDPVEATQVEVKNVINIHEKFHVVDDLVFIGFGGSNPTPFNTPLEFPEDVIEQKLEQTLTRAIESQVIRREEISQRLVLVTHTPPRDTMLDLTSTGLHVGSISVRKFIEKYSPLMNICGHIHEASGIEKIGSTLCINVSCFAWGRYAIIELKEGRLINVTFNRLD